VFCCEGFDFLHGDEVGSGKEEFDGVIAVLLGGGETFGERLVENEGAGGCFGNL
jgi:hypothetical protein